MREVFKTRETYADRIFCSEDTFAIADGMGTSIGGRVAAQRAVDLVSQHRPFRSLDEIYSFFQTTNREIMKEIAKLGDRFVAGTTLSLLSFLGDHYMIGHVGDSRIYLKREGDVELLTVDQVRCRGGRKYVKTLGIEWNPDVVLREGYVKRGDLFLLISDGAVDRITEEELERVIESDLEKSAEELLRIYMKTVPKEDLSFVIVLVE